MSEPTPPSYEESQKYALYPGGAQGSAGGTQEIPLGQTPYPPQPQQPYPVGGLQGYPAVNQPQPGFQIAVGGPVPPQPHPWYFQPPSSQYQGSAGFPQQPGYPVISQPYQSGVTYGQPYTYTTPNVGYTTATSTVTTYPPTVVTAVPSQVGLDYLRRRKLVFIILTIVIFIVFLVIIFTILF